MNRSICLGGKSPKQSLFTFCSQYKKGTPIFTDLPSRDNFFRVQLQINHLIFISKSDESRNNAQHRAALDALRFLQKSNGIMNIWPYSLAIVDRIFDSVNLNLSESKLHYHHITGYQQPWYGMQPKKDLIKDIHEILSRKNEMEMCIFLQQLATDMQFVLEYNVIHRNVNNVQKFLCFISLSKDGNNMCMCGEGSSIANAKSDAELKVLTTLSMIFPDEKLQELEHTHNYVPITHYTV